MALSEEKKRYMRLRRAGLKRRGICVDCQREPVKPGERRPGKKHILCESCLQQRRDREKSGRRRASIPPLLLAIEDAERTVLR